MKIKTKIGPPLGGGKDGGKALPLSCVNCDHSKMATIEPSGGLKPEFSCHLTKHIVKLIRPELQVCPHFEMDLEVKGGSNE